MRVAFECKNKEGHRFLNDKKVKKLRIINDIKREDIYPSSA